MDPRPSPQGSKPKTQDQKPTPYPAPIELIAEGKYSIEAVCRESKMSILELATHVCTPRNLEALGRVAQLHAIHREMLLGKLKRDALVRLAELTDEVPAGSADEIRAAEVMRKACVDLLRYGGSSTGSAAHPTPPDRNDPPEPINEEKILEALERWGREENQYEPRARASGSIVPPPPAVCTPTPLASDMNVIPGQSRYHVQTPKTSQLQELQLPPPPETSQDVPSDTHLESCLPNDSRSRIGPGARASGSYSPPESNPPPETETNPTGGTPGPLSQEELATRTGAPGKPGMPGSPAPPHDGSIGHGQSRHCPCHPTEVIEEHAAPGKKHCTMGLDHAHPP